jgi:hypothetical protein
MKRSLNCILLTAHLLGMGVRTSGWGVKSSSVVKNYSGLTILTNN